MTLRPRPIDQAGDLSHVLAAAASPRRREILRIVWNEERTAGDIHREMPDVTFGAVSLQLKLLLEAGLVEARAERRFHYYRARREAFGPVGEMLERMWSDALSQAQTGRGTGRIAPRPRPRSRAQRQPTRKREIHEPAAFARTHHHHRSFSRNCFPLLHRQRPLGSVVGRGLLDRRAPGRRGEDPPPDGDSRFRAKCWR